MIMRARSYQVHPSVALLCLLLISSFAKAVDLSVTGFGTAGFARSNEDFEYLRHIDDSGTFKADSLLGAQVELRINPQWSATVQAILSGSTERDHGTATQLRWAYVSYRPGNEWLFRAGRVRPPVFIHTQNSEVGVTYESARLPVEVYSLSPIYDVDGGAVARTWSLGSNDLTADAYWGTSDTSFRVPFQRFAAQSYFPAKFDLKGIVLSWSSGSFLVRSGFHRASLTRRGSNRFIRDFTPTAIALPEPFGGTIYEPAFKDKVHVNVFTIGVDWSTDAWRVTSEYAQRVVPDAEVGTQSKSAYLTVARTFRHWTPYMTYARLLSESEPRTIFQRVNSTPVPLAAQLPPLSLPPTFHQFLADQIFVYDQHSRMLGASYSFSATSKLKFEWMHTKVGLRSTLVDGDIRDKSFNVFTASYSVAF